VGNVHFSGRGTRVVVALSFSTVTPDRSVWSYGVDSFDIDISQQRCMGSVLAGIITTGALKGISKIVHDAMEGSLRWN
jgi:hypothetical protein